MKIGDKVPVQIGMHTVAQAEVKELGDGTATLIVPATLVVMGTRTTLDDLPPANNEGVETLITGVDRASESAAESTTGSEPNQNNEAADGQSVAPVGTSTPAPSTLDVGGSVETPAVPPVADSGAGVSDSGTPSANAPADNPATTVDAPADVTPPANEA